MAAGALARSAVEEESGAVEGNELGQADNEVKAPLVVQCGSCRTILGDTFAFVASHEELRLLVLSASVGITAGEDVFTRDGSGCDRGAAYVDLSCSHCSSKVGRRYLSTPAVLDFARDLDSFMLDCVTSYQLGSGVARTASDDVLGAAASLPSTNAASDGAVLRTEVEEALRVLSAKLTDVQTMLLVFDQRLTMLERPSSRTDSSEASQRKANGVKRMRSSVTHPR